MTGRLITPAGSGPVVQHFRYTSSQHAWPTLTPALNRMIWTFLRTGQLP